VYVYLASSWRNSLQPGMVHLLRRCGHEVYDFRKPVPGGNGFSWAQIDAEWQTWSPAEYAQALEHPIAREGYEQDMRALRACDACVLLLPSGRSASFEFGHALGAGKRGAVIMLEPREPELMYLGNPILTTIDAVFRWAVSQPGGREP